MTPMRHLFAMFLGLSFVLGCGGSKPEPSIPPPPDMPEPAPEPAMEPVTEPAPEQPSGAFDPCAGKACGEMCKLCAPNDTDCVETAVVKQCNASGQCTHEAANCP